MVTSCSFKLSMFGDIGREFNFFFFPFIFFFSILNSFFFFSLKRKKRKREQRTNLKEKLFNN